MRRRLLLVVVATTTLVVLAFAVPLGALVLSVARDRALAQAERDAAALAPVLALTTDPEIVASALARTPTGADGRLAVWLPDGDRLGTAVPRDRAGLDIARRRQAAFIQETGDGLAVFTPVVTGQGNVSVIRAAVSDDLLERGVAVSWSVLAAIAVLLVVGAAALADRLARAMITEATGLAGTARSLAGGAPHARAAPGPTPELADAARALNVLADRIEALRLAERERVADLSHRLRTPLTQLRLGAESHGAVEIVDGVDRLEAAITDLVRTARRPLDAAPARCDLVAVVRQRAAFWSALADDDGRSWTIDVPGGPAIVALGEEDAAAVVDALVGNVFSHTPERTPYAIAVEVGAIGDAGDGRVTLVVDDAGPGISDAAGAVARGVTGSGSSGLGLDIAHQAAAAAGGALAIDRSPLGGARVRLELPLV